MPETAAWAALRAGRIRELSRMAFWCDIMGCGVADKILFAQTSVWTASTIDFQTGTPRTQGGASWKGQWPPLANGPTQPVTATPLEDFVATGNPAPDVI
jgi:hypothetical protein